jgi:Dolichyl-phosphate-mannose-protein mannosyltransferase
MNQQVAVGASNRQNTLTFAALFTEQPFYIHTLLICGTAGFLSVAFGPDTNWDLLYYHLYAPWAYLHNRYLYDIGPAQAQGFLNPIADLLFYGLTSSSLNEIPRIVAFIMGAVHGINAVLIFAIASYVLCPLQLWERLTLRAVALLMGVSGAGFMSLLGTTTNDLINSIFMLGSLLAIVKVAERASEQGAWRGFVWSGLLAGIGIALKYTAAVFLPGLGLIAVIAAIRSKNASGLIAFCVAATLSFLGVAGHHLLTLWQTFGNPIFPYLNHIFRSPYYEPIWLGDPRFVPHNLLQLIAYPFYWAKTNIYVVTERPFRDWRCAIAYIAIAIGLIVCAMRHLSLIRRPDGSNAETRGLGLVFIFVVVSYVFWELGFGIYRYAVALEMLTGVVTIGVLIWLFEQPRLRVVIAMVLLMTASTTTVYLDWGHGSYGNRYVDVRVPQLPANSIVLIATWEAVAFFIPFAEPTARYLGIENNYLEISQNNKLAAEVKRLMQTPGPPKFVLSVGEFDGGKLNKLLGNFGQRLGASPCQPIWSNLDEQALSLCPVAAD